MNDFVFADTNVLVYAIDDRNAHKQERARHVLVSHASNLVISTQVMIEYFAVCSRLLRVSATDMLADINDLRRFRTVGADRRLVAGAAALAVETGLSIYDAMIAQAARQAQCAVLLTEDSDLLATEIGIEVENPFA